MLLAVLSAALGLLAAVAGSDTAPPPRPPRHAVKLVAGTPTATPTPAIVRTPTPPPLSRPPRRPFIAPDRYAGLLGACIATTERNYVWTLCPFHNVTQREVSAAWNAFYGVLGVWDTWAEAPAATEVGGGVGSATSASPAAAAAQLAVQVDAAGVAAPPSTAASPSVTVSASPLAAPRTLASFSKMLFDGGTECGANKRRRTTVTLTCPPMVAINAATVNVTGVLADPSLGCTLRDIREPATCEYTMALACPIVCLMEDGTIPWSEWTSPAEESPSPSSSPSPSASVSPSSASVTPSPSGGAVACSGACAERVAALEARVAELEAAARQAGCSSTSASSVTATGQPSTSPATAPASAGTASTPSASVPAPAAA